MNALAQVEPLIDASEAAKILDCSVRTVKSKAASGELPGLRVGNRWKFRASVLDQWVNAKMFPPLATAKPERRRA